MAPVVFRETGFLMADLAQVLRLLNRKTSMRSETGITYLSLGFG